jgi:deazaflavin-dependent oxidoreductase (nitroreductase family)
MKGGGTMTDDHPAKTPRMPPRWFVLVAWTAHRALFRLTGGRKGLWQPKPGKWGTMRLKTVGRKSGKDRVAILGYYEDGPNLVTMAMNGWADGEPAWWLNLQASPDTIVELKDGPRAVHGRVAEGEEHEPARRHPWRLGRMVIVHRYTSRHLQLKVVNRAGRLARC